MAIARPSDRGDSPATSLRPRLVIVQNINSMAKALEKPDIRLTIMATLPASVANMAKKAPTIWKNGAPGGWATCSLAEVEIYSPASQKLPVGSTVRI